MSSITGQEIRASQIRRRVVSSRQLTAQHRTWELKLSCGHTNEWHMKNTDIPKTRRCLKCEGTYA